MTETLGWCPWCEAKVLLDGVGGLALPRVFAAGVLVVVDRAELKSSSTSAIALPAGNNDGSTSLVVFASWVAAAAQSPRSESKSA
jgi:hypothetical protein